MNTHPLATSSRTVKFIDIYKQTKDEAYAAQEAWPELPPNRRKALMKKTIKLPDVRHELDKAGLGVKVLAAKHLELLNAQRTVKVDGWVEKEPDTNIQAKALSMAYELHGLLGDKKTEEAKPPTTIVNNIDMGRLAEVTDRLKQVTTKMDMIEVVDIPKNEIIDL